MFNETLFAVKYDILCGTMTLLYDFYDFCCTFALICLKKKTVFDTIQIVLFFFFFFLKCWHHLPLTKSVTLTHARHKKKFFCFAITILKKIISLTNIFPTIYNNNNTNNYNMNNNNNHSYIHEHLLTPSTPYRLVLNC